MIVLESMIRIEKLKDTKPYLHFADIKEIEPYYKEIMKNGENVFGIYFDSAVVGISYIEDDDDPYLYVYIFPMYRRKGYGYQAVKTIEKSFKASPLQRINTSYDMNNKVSKAFAQKCGYKMTWASTLMSYKGDKFDIPNLPVRNYKDTDFDKTYYFVDKAFHLMRLSTGWFPDSKLKDPNEETRKWYSDSKKDSYVYIVNNQIVGYVNIEEDEINVVAIKNEEQRKGYGRLLTEYATNIVIDRGYKEVTLWCVVNNKKARNLYDSLGFKEVFVEAFAEKKTI